MSRESNRNYASLAEAVFRRDEEKVREFIASQSDPLKYVNDPVGNNSLNNFYRAFSPTIMAKIPFDLRRVEVFEELALWCSMSLFLYATDKDRHLYSFSTDAEKERALLSGVSGLAISGTVSVAKVMGYLLFKGPLDTKENRVLSILFAYPIGIGVFLFPTFLSNISHTKKLKIGSITLATLLATHLLHAANDKAEASREKDFELHSKMPAHFFAAYTGNRHMMEILYEHGACLKHTVDGISCLHVAFQQGHWDLAQWIGATIARTETDASIQQAREAIEQQINALTSSATENSQKTDQELEGVAHFMGEQWEQFIALQQTFQGSEARLATLQERLAPIVERLAEQAEKLNTDEDLIAAVTEAVAALKTEVSIDSSMLEQIVQTTEANMTTVRGQLAKLEQHDEQLSRNLAGLFSTITGAGERRAQSGQSPVSRVTFGNQNNQSGL